MVNKLLGIDYGEERIGIAVCRRPAPPRPHSTLHRDDQTVAHITELVAQEQAEVVVVGWPRPLDAKESDQSRRIEHFAQELQTALEVPVELQDEAGTSGQARERLRRAYPHGRIPAGLVDREAAAIILEDYVTERYEKAH